jgi:hypothetical protein
MNCNVLHSGRPYSKYLTSQRIKTTPAYLAKASMTKEGMFCDTDTRGHWYKTFLIRHQ